jgi:putative transposase
VRLLTFSFGRSVRNPLQRFYGRGDLHFVTFSCYRGRPFLGTARARECFLKILDQVRLRHSFQLIGDVVMPSQESESQNPHP